MVLDIYDRDMVLGYGEIYDEMHTIRQVNCVGIILWRHLMTTRRGIQFRTTNHFFP